MTFREAVERGDRDAVASKVFPIAISICVGLAIAWVIYAFFDFGGAIASLFIGAAIIGILIAALLVGAFIADAITDMLT